MLTANDSKRLTEEIALTKEDVNVLKKLFMKKTADKTDHWLES